ncbi:16S rRNA (guanine(527)-N(7))-methyltransferase RsmG [Tumebacillus permanentifrigoris]|uniref:Ribosomal RNA small subunit methyltransferase G n=1 Tax=Tumebacillus permanentifrigoris TaxID=378543 RepID=A0A316DIZ7_9BACL|nr:16S rRNA (guanine(527)-N(7))-methyltransferase RsmG [Tumebacillus permanentifrigoris]PWK16603.1 16S rRNA m(7)G-527 methyltransferase [Tumebacillus permanentifrigoris]
MSEVQARFREEVSTGLGLTLSDPQMEQYETYFNWLVEWNEKMNLTAITDQEGVYFKHFYDSMMLLKLQQFQRSGTLLDVGAGAGFPSLPVHIAAPEIEATVVDSLNKRIGFLNELAQALGTSNYRAVHGRAEDFAQQKNFRGNFDQVTARAVARLNILLELCLPYVKVGGHFFAMKGPEADNEISESSKALQVLGGRVVDLLKMDLPGGQGSRNIVVVEKVKDTPKQYPRKAGTPSKSPL